MSDKQYRWYIIHTMSGSEKKVAQMISERAAKKGVFDSFEKIVVPVEQVIEMKRGQKVNAEHKFLPGYILVKMYMSDDTWHLVKNVPKVTGFLGANSKPQPISESEAERMLAHMQEGVKSDKTLMHFDIGESVKIIDGPFESFVGVIEELDVERSKLKVLVSIFGRSTPVELEYSQVNKL